MGFGPTYQLVSLAVALGQVTLFTTDPHIRFYPSETAKCARYSLSLRAAWDGLREGCRQIGTEIRQSRLSPPAP